MHESIRIIVTYATQQCSDRVSNGDGGSHLTGGELRMGDSNGRRCSTIHGRQRTEVGSTQRYEEIRDRSAVLGAKARPNLLCAIPEKAAYASGSPNEAVAAIRSPLPGVGGLGGRQG